jgi:transmembrane sensor
LPGLFVVSIKNKKKFVDRHPQLLLSPVIYLTMTPDKFKALLAGHQAGTLTDDEKRELSALLHDPAYRGQLDELFVENLADPNLKSIADPETLELVYQQIQLHKQPAPVRRIYSPMLKWVAAAVILLAATASWFLLFNQSPQQNIVQNPDTFTNDVAAPSYSKAMLQLADGRKIIFDSAARGPIATQGSINIIKSGDNQLIYQAGTDHNGDQVLPMNTLTVPKGSRPLQVTLADGTKIWLNAESSLHYPAGFTGNERKVQMTGEGYFEVAKQAGKKFFVLSNDVETEVLGTHFNVNAYNDEANIKITLLEGSIHVNINGQQVSGTRQPLSPGQQAQWKNGGPIKVVNDVNTEAVMAWKEGYFDFNSNDIQTVMRQLARWYNVTVLYKGEITDSRFSGIISRNNSISEVIKLLESTGKVKFKIAYEGKNVFIVVNSISS